MLCLLGLLLVVVVPAVITRQRFTALILVGGADEFAGCLVVRCAFGAT